jgi:hypothetical protein
MVAENIQFPKPSNDLPDGPCCGTCRFFCENKLKHGEDGECKFNPPIVFPNPVRKQITNEMVMGQIRFFPWMKAAEWCGQWKSKQSLES